MPKVSILVPAFRPDFLDVCIVSALNQSYRDFELVISDDSSGSDVESVVSKWKDPRVLYIKNPNRQQPGANRDHLISIAKGQYIKFLFDDDYLMPESLELLVSAADKLNGKLVFHGRYFVDSAGRVLSSPLYIQKGMACLLSSQQYFESMIGNCFNLIGEPSNILIDTQALRSIPNPFGLEERRMRFLTDVALYTNFAQRDLQIVGIGYLGSAFRQHGTQNSNTSNAIFSAGLFEWELFLRWSVDKGYLTEARYRQAMIKWIHTYRSYANDFPELTYLIELAGEGDNGQYFSERFREFLVLAYRTIEMNQAKMKK